MNFRWKLFLSFGALALTMSAVFYFYTNRFLERRLVEESRQGLLTQARMTRILLERTDTVRSLQQIAEQVAATSRARVTLMTLDGRVLADSGVRPEQLAGLENHISRPEVQAALQQDSGEALRYSETLRTQMLYVAMRCSLGSDTGMLRLAMPLEQLNHARTSLHRLLGGGMAALLALALLLSAFLSNLISRPLRVMADLAARFGAGERGMRMPAGTDDEIGYLGRVLNEMEERIEHQMRSMTNEKQRLDAILHGIGEGLIVVAADGRIVLASPAFSRIFELDRSPEGRQLIEVSRHPAILAAWQRVMASEGELTEEMSLDHNGRTLLAHWMPLRTEEPGLSVVVVFLDVTELKRLETVRRDFLANVSHELRTPLTVIKGYSETLLAKRLVTQNPEQAARFIETIHTHSGRLSRLLEDILILSRLESPGIQLRLEPIHLGEVLRNACLLHEHVAAEGAVTLQIAPGCDQMPPVLADRERLEQVLVNLLENAIKYSPGGSVRLSARAVDGMVEVSIADTGIGISERDLPRIFERFYRVDSARDRDLGGTGLGLAIVKHIVQLHGGSVWATSRPGTGSTFCFTLRQAEFIHS